MNINYILKNQNKLQTEEYVGLADHLHNREADDNVPPDKMFILPSTFKSSPRSQIQRFQDAMAVAWKSIIVHYSDLQPRMAKNPAKYTRWMYSK